MAEQANPVLVSVAMPIYNAGAHLRLAVLSIISQTFTQWELLIIDDGSTDDALKGIADIKDARIRIYCDGANHGLAARLNEACHLASGVFFARMDQDDVSYPKRFELQVSALKSDPALDLVATRAILIDEDNMMVGVFPFAATHDEICKRPWSGFYLPHSTWMGRRDWFLAHRYAQNPAPYFCEDQELLTRTWQRSRFAAINDVLLAYRIRKSVNWRKLALTRSAILKMQVRIFTSAGTWSQLLLASLSYLVKTASDAKQRLLHATPKRNDFDVKIAAQWQNLLARLSGLPNRSEQ